MLQTQILTFLISDAGGIKTLSRYGRVTGADLSLTSLLEAKKIYHAVYQIDGKNLPFPDGYFDLVYNSHVFGHVPLNSKSHVVKEIFRVLKSGGHLICSIECDSESIVYRRAKKYPDMFRQCYVDEWGHHGLELPHENFRRFQEAGFLPVIEIADIHKGYLRPATSYLLLRKYKGKDRLLYGLGGFSYFVSKSRILTLFFDLLFGLMIPFAYLFTPPSHRDSAKVVYQKP
jgi:ubiquinone/menaquinone biosynthesis C-methylase UbiE